MQVITARLEAPRDTVHAADPEWIRQVLHQADEGGDLQHVRVRGDPDGVSAVIFADGEEPRAAERAVHRLLTRSLTRELSGWRLVSCQAVLIGTLFAPLRE